MPSLDFTAEQAQKIQEIHNDFKAHRLAEIDAVINNPKLNPAVRADLMVKRAAIEAETVFGFARTTFRQALSQTRKIMKQKEHEALIKAKEEEAQAQISQEMYDADQEFVDV